MTAHWTAIFLLSERGCSSYGRKCQMMNNSNTSSAASRRAKRRAKERVRAAAVAQFREAYDPNKPYEPIPCRICNKRHVHEPLYTTRIIYGMDSAAMMHGMGDYNMLKFTDEKDCHSKLRSLLTTSLDGAVVVWEYRERRSQDLCRCNGSFFRRM